MAEELAATQHRPSGWLPRTVFVEEDEYEAGFTQYEVTEIHSNVDILSRLKTGAFPLIFVNSQA